MDNLQTKTEKLLKYGKTKLSEKGVESAATDIRGVLDDIGSISVQPTLQEKSITITENGTTEVVADSGYDGLAKVSIEANMQGGGSDLLNVIKGMNSYNVNTPEYHFELTADMFDENSTEIYKYKYAYNKNITKVEIPNGITSIGESAFYGCSSLTSITIPDSVTRIERTVFQGCNSLQRVDITDIAKWCDINFSYDASNPLYYAKNLYLNGKLITDLVIPNGVTSIKYNTFCYCSLTSITTPNSVTSIESYVFNACNNLISVKMGQNLTSIASYAFYRCGKLAIVDFRSATQVPTIQSNSFNNVPKTCKFIIPDELYDSWIVATNWASLYAQGYQFVKESDYPTEGLAYTLNSDSTSYSCSGIGTATDTNITVAKTYNDLPVTGVKNDAFREYNSITKIVIPNSITTLGDHSFYGCLNLATAKFANDIQLSTIDKFAFAYSGITNIQIPDSGVEIKGAAFSDCTQLTNIVLPDSVSIIETGVFGNCTSLSSIQLPNTMTSIPAYTFKGCTGLTNITIPAQVSTIGTYAFGNCSSLTKIDCTNAVSVPVLEDQYALTGIPSTCQIVVPDALYDEWIAATNWVTHASQIVKASEYTEVQA